MYVTRATRYNGWLCLNLRSRPGMATGLLFQATTHHHVAAVVEDSALRVRAVSCLHDLFCMILLHRSSTTVHHHERARPARAGTSSPTREIQTAAIRPMRMHGLGKRAIGHLGSWANAFFLDTSMRASKMSLRSGLANIVRSIIQAPRSAARYFSWSRDPSRHY